MNTVNRTNFAPPLPKENPKEHVVNKVAKPKQQQDSLVAALARRVNPAYWQYLLVIADALLILVGFAGAYYLRYQLQWFRSVDPASQRSFVDYLPVALALMLVLLVAYRLSGVYPYRIRRNLAEESYTIATASTAGVFGVIVVTLFFRQLLYSRLIFLYTALLVTILLSISRFVIYLLRAHLRAYGIGVTRVLLVGVGDVGRMVMRIITARPDLGLQLVGFLDDNPNRGNTDIGPFRGLGSIDNFEQLMDGHGAIQNVIICLPWQSHRTVQRLLRACEQANVRAQVVPDFFQWTRDQLQVDELNGIPLISRRPLSIQGWNLVLKRALDLLLTVLFGLVAAPLMALIALLIKLDAPGPIIYSQLRVGKNNKPFLCHKFRSMVPDAEELRNTLTDLNEATGPLFKVRDDPRQTRVGRLLRRFSLDELPQFYNVLCGEMSLIGPRPNLPGEVEQYQEWHKKRLAVSPGITGLWQVSGRSDLTFDEMVLLDIYYVENWSILLDASILLRSIPAILRGRGAY